MNNIFTKILSDLGCNKSRHFLAVVNIAAGVFSLGTLLGMIDIQQSQMDQAHRQSIPAHIEIILRGAATKPLLTELTSIPGVEGVDVLAQTTVRFRKPDEPYWRLATLQMRPDYLNQKYDQVRLQEGAWPEAKNLAVERMSSSYYGIPLGSELLFETADGNENFRVGGLVRHPFIKPPQFGGQPYFLVSAETFVRFGISAGHFNQLLIRIKPPYSLEKTRAIAAEIRSVLGKQGLNVGATLFQDPNKHWGHVFFAGINKVLSGMAWASLALSCVLIFNTVTAHMNEQSSQIGILKAIGASRKAVFSIYLVEFLLLAVTAVLVALPLSLAAAYWGSGWLLALFNIEMPNFQYSSRAILIMSISGIAVVLLASLFPIMNAASRTVRSALDTHGIGTDFIPTRFDYYLELLSLRFLPTLYATALANVFRKKLRLLWNLGVLVIAGVMFLVLFALRSSVDLTLDNELARTRYDVRFGFLSDQPIARLTELLQTQPKTLKTEYWRRLPVEIKDNSDKPLIQKGSLGLQLMALPVSSVLYQPYIVAGRWFNQQDRGRKTLVMSAETADLNRIHIGDFVEVTLANRKVQWQVIGLYRWLAGANFVVEPVYAPLDTIQSLISQDNMATYAVVSAALSNLQEEHDYAESLKELFWMKGIKLDIFTTVAKREQRAFAKRQFMPVTGMLFGLSSMIAVIAAIGLAGALAINVLQRKREIAILRTIGAPNRAIFGMFMLEGILHGLLAWLISVPLAYWLGETAAEQLGLTMFGIRLDYRFDPISVLYWLLGVILLTVLAAWWPSKQAMKLTVKAGLD